MVHASKNEVGSGRSLQDNYYRLLSSIYCRISCCSVNLKYFTKTNSSLERSGPELSICVLLAQKCHI